MQANSANDRNDVNTPVRLVISDIDGTIVTHEKVLTQASIDAVKKLREAGIRFTLISSRPPRGMKTLMDAHSVIGPAVPPGEFTCTVIGFESDGVTMAFSLETVSVLEPLLPVPGLELL